METLTFNNRKMPFQKGMIIAIKGAIKLQDYLNSNYDISLLPCESIIQDWLERIHGILRQMGVTDMRPSPLDYLFRLRNYILEIFLENDNFDINEF